MSSSVYELAEQLVAEAAQNNGDLNRYVYTYARIVQGAPTYYLQLEKLPPQFHELSPLTLGWSNWNGQFKNYSPVHGYALTGQGGNPTQSVTLTDCSGFTASIIEKLSGQLYDTFCGVVANAGLQHDQPWPSAAAYTLPLPGLEQVFDLIGNETNEPSLYEAIKNGQVQPGDFLAWAAPPHANDTGHVMVVAEQPQPATVTDTWFVRVYDSSGCHLNDTRATQTYKTGVGCGTVIIHYDAEHAQWNVSLAGDLPLNPPKDDQAPTPTPVNPSPLPPYTFFIAPHIAVQRLKI